MDTDGSLRIVLLIISILFSALFSGSEVALFSSDKKSKKELKKPVELTDRYISALLSDQKRLLVTILVGNTVFNVAASIIGVSIALSMAKTYNIAEDLALLLQIIVLTLLILFFGEITPKVYATKNPNFTKKVAAIPLYWFSVVVYPISKTLTELIGSFTSKLKYDKSSTALKSSEISDLADLGKESGSIDEDEHNLIHGMVSFKTITAREAMTPRVDFTAVPFDIKLDELMEIITESGHSRIPLYKENQDDIEGIIYAKDLLPFMGSHRKVSFSVAEIARQPVFIPETKLISELLHEFRESKTHIGIVVDEYGGTSGLITLEDILEEIVGEIRDEYDKEEQEITKLADGSFLLLGKTPIDEITEILNADFSSPNDHYDTLGGFIFNRTGSIPEVGYKFVSADYEFLVKEVENNRIKRVLAKKVDRSN